MSPIFPSRKRELILGLIYLPLHIFLMPIAVSFISPFIFTYFKIRIASSTMTLIYYSIAFVIVLILMWGFLRDSFSAFIDRYFTSTSLALYGFFLNFMAMFFLGAIYLLVFKQSAANPNNAAVAAQVANRSSHLIFAMVVLAPIVEESIFRGSLFDLVRRKSRIAAYVITYLLFSAYHLWTYALNGVNLMFVFYMLQYLPPSIILANCYEKSGTIWSPIILHMLNNGVSAFLTLS